jgi:hypothetical protein
MSDPNEWIKDFLPEDDIAKIQAKAERIIDAEGTFYEMTVSMSRHDMLEAVRAGYGMQEGDAESWLLGVSIIMALFRSMQDCLEADGVDIWETPPE